MGLFSRDFQRFQVGQIVKHRLWGGQILILRPTLLLLVTHWWKNFPLGGYIGRYVGIGAYRRHRFRHFELEAIEEPAAKSATADESQPRTVDELQSAVAAAAPWAARLAPDPVWRRRALGLAVLAWPENAEELYQRKELRRTLYRAVWQNRRKGTFDKTITFAPLAVTIILVVVQALISWWLQNHPVRQETLLKLKAELAAPQRRYETALHHHVDF